MHGGFREDGTFKDIGWLGDMQVPGGGHAGEYSIGEPNSQWADETFRPTLTPNLSPEEISTMINDVIPNHKHTPRSIVIKSQDFANERVAQGKSPFWNRDQDSPTTFQQLRKAAGGGFNYDVPGAVNTFIERRLSKRAIWDELKAKTR